mgnify:CR=1
MLVGLLNNSGEYSLIPSASTRVRLISNNYKLLANYYEKRGAKPFVKLIHTMDEQLELLISALETEEKK